jgi:hypothetical protein
MLISLDLATAISSCRAIDFHQPDQVIDRRQPSIWRGSSVRSANVSHRDPVRAARGATIGLAGDGNRSQTAGMDQGIRPCCKRPPSGAQN